MATERRVLRLQQLILEAAAKTVQQELSDPRIELVSITRVKLAPDLTAARLFWSCIGDDAKRRTCARGLQDALPVIQRAVAGALQTRVTPRLSLADDRTLLQAERLERIFQTLRDERGDAPEEEGASSQDAQDVSHDDAHEVDDEDENDMNATDPDADATDPDADEPDEDAP